VNGLRLSSSVAGESVPEVADVDRGRITRRSEFGAYWVVIDGTFTHKLG
jgi:hypothetical protein